MKKSRLIGLFVVLACVLAVSFAFTPAVFASANEAATTSETATAVEQSGTAARVLPNHTRETRPNATTPDNQTAPTPIPNAHRRGGNTGNTTDNDTSRDARDSRGINRGTSDGTAGFGNTGTGTPLNDYNAHNTYNTYNNNSRRTDNTYNTQNRGTGLNNTGVAQNSQNANTNRGVSPINNQDNQGQVDTTRRTRVMPNIQTVPLEEGCIIIVTYNHDDQASTQNSGNIQNNGINTIGNNGVDTYGARNATGGMNNGVTNNQRNQATQPQYSVTYK